MVLEILISDIDIEIEMVLISVFSIRFNFYSTSRLVIIFQQITTLFHIVVSSKLPSYQRELDARIEEQILQRPNVVKRQIVLENKKILFGTYSSVILGGLAVVKIIFLSAVALLVSPSITDT